MTTTAYAAGSSDVMMLQTAASIENLHDGLAAGPLGELTQLIADAMHAERIRFHHHPSTGTAATAAAVLRRTAPLSEAPAWPPTGSARGT